jgi:hypothetical protein
MFGEPGPPAFGSAVSAGNGVKRITRLSKLLRGPRGG